MESITVVRCPACGYDGNNPFFRFCGICGTPLPKEKEQRPAPARAKTGREAPLTVNSFSILGLQEDPAMEDAIREAGSPARESSSGQSGLPLETARYADYLLDEEDTGPPRWRLYSVLAVLVISIAVLGWQWERDHSSLTLLAAAINPPRPAAAAQEAPVVPESAPAATPVPATPSPTAEIPAPAEKPVTPSAQAIPENQPAGESPAPVAAKPAVSDAPKSTAPAPAIEPAQPQDQTPVVKSSPAPKAAAPAAAASTPEPVAAPAQAASFSPADAARLFEEGQKFLYGDGAAQDCGRALQDLRQAARINAEAASLLGTMYASGHCVSKNLPPAYHWYARALHRDSTNSRYQSDLEVIWNQMTPAEKQAAMRIAP